MALQESPWIAIGVFVPLLGCLGDDLPPASGTTTSEPATVTTDGETTAAPMEEMTEESSDGGLVPVVDLFGCRFDPSCDAMQYEDAVETPEAQRCAAQIVFDRAQGVVVGTQTTATAETETIVLLLGGVTAAMQTKEGTALSEQMSCTVAGAAELMTACEGPDDSGCVWNPWGVDAPGLENCLPLSQSYSCADAKSLLGE